MNTNNTLMILNMIVPVMQIFIFLLSQLADANFLLVAVSQGNSDRRWRYKWKVWQRNSWDISVLEFGQML